MASSSEGERAAVAVSGQGERAAVAVSGQGEREALAVSGQGGRAAAAVSGDGLAAAFVNRKRSILEYPCTERLRWRRFLAYLRENCYDQIYHVAKDNLGVIFDVEDLVKRVKAGQLEEARDYAWTFAPIPIGQLSSHAELLTLFLQYFTAIHRFADGDTAMEEIVHDWFRKLHRHPAVLSKYPCLATLVADVLSLRTHHVRNSFDWQLVRNKAAEMVEEMVSRTPELREMTRYPIGQTELYNVMPIRCSFRPRRQVKNTGKKQATDFAKFYLEMKKRLLTSAQMECHDYSGSARESGVMLIELFEKVLQAGQRMVLKQGHPPEYLSRGVSTVKAADVCKSVPGHVMIEKGHRPEHASNQVFPFEAMHAYKSIAMRMRIEQGHQPEHASNQAIKRPRLLESHQDTFHQGNALKRLGNWEFREMDHSFVEQPLTYLDAVAVLNWRGRLARLTDRLVRLLPVSDAVTTLRRSLEEILRCCSTTTVLGTKRMVLMSLIQAELWRMRDAFGVMDNPLLHEAMAEQPAILRIFSSIYSELNLLEQLCSCATALHEAPTQGPAALAYEAAPAAG